jgi:ribonucleoside-diphosphate reductase beta chain
MHRLLTDPSPAAQAEALVTYSLVGEGVLGDAGYHLFTAALAGGDRMPGFRDGLARSQADEQRHLTYGLFLLSRLVAEGGGPEVWSAISRRMEELLPLTLGIVSEFFEPYDPMPFGLSLDDTVQDAIARFANRWAALEEVKQRGRSLATPPGADQVVRAVLGWVGDQLQPVPIEVRREGTGPVYTFHVGSAGALLITEEVVAHHSSDDVIAALRSHRVPERLRAAKKARLTCLSAGGKIIVQPPE